MEEFAYFMIRLQRGSPEVPVPAASGMVERLDTGEKWSFGSTEELLRLMAVAPPAAGKMHAPDGADKSGGVR